MRRALVLTVLVAACAGGEDGAAPPATTSTTATAPAPVLVAAERIDAPDVEGTAWRVRYTIEGIDGSPTDVTGVVVRPRGEAPPGGFPVLAWAHATIGVADACIPASSELGELGIPVIDRRLAAGFVVAATDYEGVGGPGTHPYLVPSSEARSVLGVVRAAAEVDGADAGSAVVLAGHSQGGGAVLEALARRSELAPDLDIVGGVSLASSSGVVDPVPTMFRRRSLAEFALLVAVSWGDVYPELDVADVVGPAGMPAVDAARSSKCLNELEPFLGDVTVDELFPTKPDELEAWRARIDEHEVDPSTVDRPLFVGGGDQDPLFPPEVIDDVVGRLCRAGVVVTDRRYRNAAHGTTVQHSAADVHEWIRARLAGEAPPDDCPGR